MILQERRYDFVGVGFEDIVDVAPEERRDFESEREARHEFSVLNGVHRLPGDAQTLREIRLRHVELGPQDAQTILQR
jgi:hypothetical protein